MRPEQKPTETQTLLDAFDHALRELYSLEDTLADFGQQNLADVLRSVVEMCYGKLHALDGVIGRDVGPVQVELNEFGEAVKAHLMGKPTNQSIQ